MILRYIYREHNGSKQLAGCVVKTDEGRLGYSAIHPNDRAKMNKKLARTIAIGRAEKCRIQIDDVFGEQPPRWMKTRGALSSRMGYIVPRAIIPYLVEIAQL